MLEVELELFMQTFLIGGFIVTPHCFTPEK
jgi:hypothetical protein